MPVNVYSILDPGAPIVGGLDGSLPNLLKACLVDGYGSKAPAGWTLEYEDPATYTMVFRQGGGNRRYLRVQHDTQNYPNVRGFKTMVDTVEANGSAPFPSIAQLSGGIRPVTSNALGASRAWMVFATDLCVLVYLPFTTADLSVISTSTDYLFFGDLVSGLPGDATNTAIIGKTVANTTASNTVFMNSLTTGFGASSGHYTMGSYQQVEGSVNFGCLRAEPAASASAGSAGWTYPNPMTGGLVLERVRTTEGPVPRGFLPGVFNPIHNQPGNHLDVLQGRGSLAGKDIMLLYKGGIAGRIAVSLDESDWR